MCECMQACSRGSPVFAAVSRQAGALPLRGTETNPPCSRAPQRLGRNLVPCVYVRVSACICDCVCVCVCVSTRISVYVPVCLRISVSFYPCMRVCVCMHACIYHSSCASVSLCMHVFALARACANKRKRASERACACIRNGVSKYLCACVLCVHEWKHEWATGANKPRPVCPCTPRAGTFPPGAQDMSSPKPPPAAEGPNPPDAASIPAPPAPPTGKPILSSGTCVSASKISAPGGRFVVRRGSWPSS